MTKPTFKTATLLAITGAFLQSFIIHWTWMSPTQIFGAYITRFLLWFVAGLIITSILSRFRTTRLVFDIAMIDVFCSVYLWIIVKPNRLGLPLALAITCGIVSVGLIPFLRKGISIEKIAAIIGFALSIGFLGLFLYALPRMTGH